MFNFLKYFSLLLALTSMPPMHVLHAQEDDLSELEGELDEASDQKTAEKPTAKKEAPSRAEVAKSEQLKGVDDPDYELEDRVFKIFSELKGPISDTTWKKIVGQRKSETYKIQKGDTLWDISKTLFGDPYYWPKVWAINDDISNPHFITTGSRLSFYQGTVNDEPAIDIKVPETKETKIPAPKVGGAVPVDKLQESEPDLLPGEEEDFLPQAGLRAETTEDVIIPSTKYKSSPKLKSIPPSLPIWDRGATLSKRGMVAFSGRAPSTPKAVSVPLPAFIAEEFPEAAGRIIEFKDGANGGTNYNYVYAEVKGGKIDDNFLVVSKIEKPQKFYKVLDGVPISVDGEVKLVEEIEKGEVFKAVITTTLNPILKGAKLVALKLPLVEVSTIGPILNVEGRIGGGGMEGQTDYFGVGSIVFMNIGTVNGVKVGGLIHALADEKLRYRKTIDDVNKRDVGLVKVIHATENLSTGMVVQANDVVMSGDYLGLPGPTNGEILALTSKKKGAASVLEDLAKEDVKEQESVKGKPKEKKKKASDNDDDEGLDDLNDDDF